jgi:uncharacterized RDD family membrane protein YckC
MTFTAYPQNGPADGPDSSTMPRPAQQFETWKHGYAGHQKLTAWPLRLASGAIDYLPLLLVWDLFSKIHLFVFGLILTIAAIGFNNIYMQGMTGQSLGKRIVGTRLVSLVNDGPMMFTFVYPGPGRCLGRQLSHFVDSLLFYTGWFRPLWQNKHQTWADSIAKTVVIPANSDSLVVKRPQGAVSTL